ncbi:MAG: sugar O-acetyltransferase [Kiritimatiellae bacterium]|nr:sugar O-acetyltransferase [Kiritimatiellia bacterium]
MAGEQPPLPARERQGLVRYAVKEIAVVRDNEHRLFVGGQKVLKPSEGRGIQVVGRLVQKDLGKTHGDNITILPTFWCDYGYNIELGANFFANHNTVILDGAKVKFGDNVFIAPNCSFYTAGHPLDVERRNKGLEYAYPITVGDNVWIGGNVTVCPGVTIGSNVVIGAGAVVTHDIPDNALAFGVPARVVRKIEPSPSKS